MFFMMDNKIGKGNNWDLMGTPLSLGDGEHLTGCIEFSGCYFEGCTFHHITPIISSQEYDGFLGTFPEQVRMHLKPALGSW